MESPLFYIKDNIAWIKDIFTVIFAGVATILAIFAYIRARATILQPIRNEVIKKQSELLTEMLNHIAHSDNSIDNGLDYVGIAANNAFLILRDYGFIFKNHKEVLERVQEQIAGWIPCGKSNILKDVRIVGMFNEKEVAKQDVNDSLTLGKEKFEKAKEGLIEIDKIYFTKKYSEFFKKLSDYSGNPFLPANIQKVLSKILEDIHVNLTQNLKLTLDNFMKVFCDSYFNKKEVKDISPIGVYNDFNHNRIHHKTDFEVLKNEIRNYLRIDERW